jgi:hypothetical protein
LNNANNTAFRELADINISRLDELIKYLENGFEIDTTKKG